MIKREIQELFQSYLKSFPVVVLTGARQVGKTTFLKNQVPKGYGYVLLEDPDVRRLAIEDPRGFFERHPAPLIIDEFQEVPELLSYLQGIVDNERHKKGQYILTGSQNFLMMEKLTQSLAGRAGVLELFPLSSSELGLDEKLSRSELISQMIKGFYPEINDDVHVKSTLWFSSYIKTYIERDVRSLTQLGDLARFDRFVRMLAIRTGTILNVSEVARDSGITPTTAERWLSLMEQSYLVFKLEPYFSNLSSRIRKSPKVYFYDVGLAAYLAGYRGTTSFEASPHLGAFFETLVVSDIKKQLAHSASDKSIFYLNIHKVAEVDLLWETVDGGKSLAEIKMTQTPRPELRESLNKVEKALGTGVNHKYLVGSFSSTSTVKKCSFVPWTKIVDFINT